MKTIGSLWVVFLWLAIPLAGVSQDIRDMQGCIRFEKKYFPSDTDTTSIFNQLSRWKTRFDSLHPDRGSLTIDDVSGFIFDSLGITAERDSVRLTSLVTHKRGNCVTIGLLYYWLLDPSPLPLYVIHVPEHFYLRTHLDSATYINIEPTLEGMALPDSLYLTSRPVSEEAFQQGCYMTERDYAYLEDAYKNNLAVLMQSKLRCDEAVQIFSHSLQSYPANPEILVNRGDCYRLRQAYDEAIDDYSRAISMYDLDIRYFERRAIAYVNIGNCLRAIDDFTEILRRLGHHGVVLLNRGKAYFNCNQVDKGCQDWKDAQASGNIEAGQLFRLHCK